MPEGAPPLDWSGELVIEQSWREVAWPIAATAIPVLVALVAYVVTGSLLALMGAGIVAGAAALALDTRRPR